MRYLIKNNLSGSEIKFTDRKEYYDAINLIVEKYMNEHQTLVDVDECESHIYDEVTIIDAIKDKSRFNILSVQSMDFVDEDKYTICGEIQYVEAADVFYYRLTDSDITIYDVPHSEQSSLPDHEYGVYDRKSIVYKGATDDISRLLNGVTELLNK